MNHIDGTVALDYARLREIDSDWQRVERQRKVILAVVNQLKNSGLDDLDNLLNQVLPLIQTDMTMLEITQLMLYSPNFLKAEFDQMTIPREGTYGAMSGMGGRTLFAVDFEEDSRILREFLYGETEKP
jgi:anionic cell wall polymer biosynthesis LytR-Cps2A-Psr (LCP) family protein